MDDFSEWLNNKIDERGWSKAELSRRSKISKAQITRIMNREQRPGRDSLTAFAHALRETPDTLYRVAGLLPPIDPDDSDLEDFREILRQLTPAEREELKRIGWLKIDMKRQAPTQKGIDQTKK